MCPSSASIVQRVIIILSVLLSAWGDHDIHAQTAAGELEARPAPVARRKCIGGGGSGSLCNADGDCPGSTCPDRNVFNISVAVLFNATAAEITDIENMISAGSQVLFDITDGQAEIGEAFIYNNAFGTGSDADVRVFPSTTDTWWNANTGNWQTGGGINVSINYIQAAGNVGESFAHEFVHLVFDARDEYESRPAGCTDPTTPASCPDGAAGAVACLMDDGGLSGNHTELCWGQGNSANLTDLTAGNHDATNVTEQSRCRNNRSCWAQVVWGWPNTFTAPTGAPDADAHGATVHATHFVVPDNTARIVLVLDESGSMGSESPTRMQRLKTAALDFITMAENGTELGIVSYSDDAAAAHGRVNVPIAALGSTRTTWTNAVNGLSPAAWTNIGDGLQKAIDMITAAGGVTANTFIVLMTDGINNRPAPQSSADADLQAKIDALLAAGIPVYVTCTGSDVGLSSQCSEIATGTGGFYVDSSDPARMAEAFVDIHERTARRDAIGSYLSWANETGDVFYVEEGSESATFTLVWQEGDGKGSMWMVAPDGTTYKSSDMPKGRYVRVKSPVNGEWRMRIDWSGTPPAHFVKRGYSRNAVSSLTAGVRYASVLPDQELYIYAYPRSNGGSVTDTTQRIKATVIRPDGTLDHILLDDLGSTLGTGGDDDKGDGTFTGVYRKTDLKGSYQFLIRAEVDGWLPSEVAHEHKDEKGCPRFVREVRISASVGDPKDEVKEPEDGKPNRPGDKPHGKDWWKWLKYILGLLLALLAWYFWRRRNKR